MEIIKIILFKTQTGKTLLNLVLVSLLGDAFNFLLFTFWWYFSQMYLVFFSQFWTYFPQTYKIFFIHWNRKYLLSCLEKEFEYIARKLEISEVYACCSLLFSISLGLPFNQDFIIHNISFWYNRISFLYLFLNSNIKNKIEVIF